MLKVRLFGAACAMLSFVLPQYVHAAPVYDISVTGQIVPDNSWGTLTPHIGRNFIYEATFELDTAKAVNTWVNPGGWTVYELDDGGVTYGNSACIYDGTNVAGGDCFASNIVGFEFNDNLVLDWSSDTTLAFLNIGLPDGTPLDAIVLGFADPLINDNTEFWMTMLFSGDLFTGYSATPQTIDLNDLIAAGGEFGQITDGSWTGYVDENGWIGFAQFRVDSAQISAVPVPAAVWLFGSGLLALTGVARRKKSV